MTDQKTKAKAGWYPDPKRPGEIRRWDGNAWVDEWRPESESESGPASLMMLGFFIMVGTGALGAVFLGVEGAEWVSISVWAIGGLVGGTMFQVATIAMGVQIGNRASR